MVTAGVLWQVGPNDLQTEMMYCEAAISSDIIMYYYHRADGFSPLSQA